MNLIKWRRNFAKLKIKSFNYLKKKILEVINKKSSKNKKIKNISLIINKLNKFRITKYKFFNNLKNKINIAKK